jgi:hypothetical protein
LLIPPIDVPKSNHIDLHRFLKLSTARQKFSILITMCGFVGCFEQKNSLVSASILN